MEKIKQLTNHVILTLDGSGSMARHKDDLITVADKLVDNLAQRSVALEQETRITVYSFSGRREIFCLIWDMDVLRLPSIAKLYDVNNMTALIDASLKAIRDAKSEISQVYGDHAFIMYVLTDGYENHSFAHATELKKEIEGLPANWTVATFVPDNAGVAAAKLYGFPADNIAVWNTASVDGIIEVGKAITEATESFMQARKAGVRGTRSLFKLNTVSLANIQTTLTPVAYGKYTLLNVPYRTRIDDFVVNALHIPYKIGDSYYELVKKETIQAKKKVALMANNRVWVGQGQEVRDMLGLPDANQDVIPGDHPDYVIFVQSTAINRILPEKTRMLYLPEANLPR